MTTQGAKASASYAEWVRRAVAPLHTRGKEIVALFDSSVPEPRDLLTSLVAAGFAEPVTPFYVSAFSRGNPFVVAHLARRYGVDPERILCSTGATGALSLIYHALTVPGDHVVIETPGFDLFQGLARDARLDISLFERAAPDFDVDVDAIEAALRPNTRLVVLSNLHNPTSMIVSQASLAALAQLAERRGLLVVVDEVYSDYADRSARLRPAATLSPNFISVSSLTKIYGLSTVRCGWVVADPSALAPVRAISEKFEFGISNLAHAAAALVFEHEDRFAAYTGQVLDRVRPVMAERFASWRADGLIEGGMPPFGCIAFPRLVGIDDTEAFAEWLSERSGVVVAPGEYFGAPGHIRIGFAQPDAALARGLEALDTGLRAYRAERTRPAVAPGRL